MRNGLRVIADKLSCHGDGAVAITARAAEQSNLVPISAAQTSGIRFFSHQIYRTTEHGLPNLASTSPSSGAGIGKLDVLITYPGRKLSFHILIRH